MRSTGRDLPRRGQSPQWSGTCREGAQRGREARLDHGRARLRTEIPQGRPCRKGDRGGQSGSSTWARVSGCSFCPGPNSSLPSLPSASTAVLFTGPLLQESPLSEDRPDFSAEPPASCFGRGVGGPWGVSLLRLRLTFSPLPSLWAERHLCWRQAPLCPRTQGYCKGKVKVRTAERGGGGCGGWGRMRWAGCARIKGAHCPPNSAGFRPIPSPIPLPALPATPFTQLCARMVTRFCSAVPSLTQSRFTLPVASGSPLCRGALVVTTGGKPSV